MAVKRTHVRMRIFIVDLLKDRELSAFSIAEIWGENFQVSTSISTITSQLRISKMFEADVQDLAQRNTSTIWKLSENYQEIFDELLKHK